MENSPELVLLNELTDILSHHAGERGESEGALETLERIVRERDARGPETIVGAQTYRKILDRLLSLADSDFKEGPVDALERLVHERDVLMNQWPAGVDGHALMERLKGFVADVVRVKPSADDGEGFSIEFVGSFARYNVKDEELYSFTVETKRFETGL